MDSSEHSQARRKKSVAEEHSRKLLRASGVAMIVSRGAAEKVEIVNDKFTKLFGYTIEEIPKVERWWRIAYPDENYREAIKIEWQRRTAKAIAKRSNIEPLEAKVRCKDGSERYIEFHFSCLGNTNLVSFVDLTERERAEEALTNMTRKLVEAHEEERTRIARELHDDIGQRLSLLSIELGRLQQRAEELPPEVLSDVSELLHQTTNLTNDVQTMSHNLHPARLEILGLVVAMKCTCQEFSQQHNLEINFKSHGLHLPLPSDVSLTLFRVLQEALRNASKHSGAKQVEVQIGERSGKIRLIVRDAGKGFDLNAAMQGQGLGLTSMQERVRLVNGTITIDSTPMGGTTVSVSVPLASGHDVLRAAG